MLCEIFFPALKHFSKCGLEDPLSVWRFSLHKKADVTFSPVKFFNTCRRNVFSSLQVPLPNGSLPNLQRGTGSTQVVFVDTRPSFCSTKPHLSRYAGTRGDKATLDVPQSQPSRRKAASSCQATPSVSLQEVKSNRTLITFNSVSPESQSHKRTVRLRLVQSL